MERRLDDLVEAMRKSPVLRDVEITKSTVIKAALRRGLPFMELEHGGVPKGAIRKDDLAGWIALTVQELLEWADTLDLKLPRFGKK